jgi:hypothetical protein
VSPAVLILGAAFAAGVGLGAVLLLRGLFAALVVRRRLNAWKRTADADAAALDRPPP